VSPVKYEHYSNNGLFKPGEVVFVTVGCEDFAMVGCEDIVTVVGCGDVRGLNTIGSYFS